MHKIRNSCTYIAYVVALLFVTLGVSSDVRIWYLPNSPKSVKTPPWYEVRLTTFFYPIALRVRNQKSALLVVGQKTTCLEMAIVTGC